MGSKDPFERPIIRPMREGLRPDASSGGTDSAIPSSATIGVAISGGGVRAAFFALGALTYLVHSGLHRRVRLISSVSGGSIVSMAVATAGDFSSADAVEFGRLVGRISSRMATWGVFFWPRLRRLLPLGLWAPLYIFGMNLVGAMDGWDWRVFWLGEILYTGGMVLYLLLGRQRFQQSAYRLFLTRTVQEDSPRRLRREPTLGDLPQSTVVHVLCATELTSGQPFYMSRDMVLSPVYGRGRPSITQSQAIYASAAFPIGFPPLRVRSEKLSLTDGYDDEPPKRLALSDGGVFNNLGTETFSARSSTQVFLPDPALPIIPQADLQLVVNASSPPKRILLRAIPGWRFVASTKRIMTVMYENTLRPRMQRLMEAQAGPHGPIVVDVSESPIELLDRLTQGRQDSDQVRARAQDSRAKLRRDRSDSQWKEYSDLAAATKTVLSAVGRVAAVRLIRLGYLNTAVACHAHFGVQGVGSVPEESWFRDLVGNRLTEDQLRAPTVEQEPASTAIGRRE